MGKRASFSKLGATEDHATCLGGLDGASPKQPRI
jgi:hypothetical protein